MSEEVKNIVVEEQNFDSVEQQDEALFNKETPIIKDEPIVDKEVKKDEIEEVEVKEPEDEEVEEIEDEGKVLVEGSPRFKQIAKEFPEFFKKFPEMRDIVGREQAYNELFGSVEDAKAAKENEKDFTFFSEKVISGDAKAFLEVVKDSGKSDLTEFVNNFLPALKELDNSLYTETTAPLFVDVMQTAYNDAKRAGNENLENAVLHVAKYLFNDHRFATGEVKLKAREKTTEVKTDSIAKERESLMLEHYKSAYIDVNDNLENKLNSLVKSELPEDMSELDKELLPERIIKEAGKLLASDTTHMNNMSRLWKMAEGTKYDFSSRQRIIAAVMNRYKEVLPEIRRKYISKVTGKSVRQESRREVTTSSNRGNPNRRSSSAKEIDWKQTSDEDLFSGRATYKS